MNKTCTRCNNEKVLSHFCKDKRRKDGRTGICKECQRIEDRKYRTKNASILKTYRLQYRKDNPDYFNNWYQDNKDEFNKKNNKKRRDNRDIFGERQRIYLSRNKEKYNETSRKYIKRRRENEPNFKLRLNLRTSISRAIKYGKAIKYVKSFELVGCTIEELRKHLEKSFSPGMKWSNYGKWHVDHILPCASFDLTNHEQQRECFHYSNLQPLWAHDNWVKGARVGV